MIQSDLISHLAFIKYHVKIALASRNRTSADAAQQRMTHALDLNAADSVRLVNMIVPGTTSWQWGRLLTKEDESEKRDGSGHARASYRIGQDYDQVRYPGRNAVRGQD